MERTDSILSATFTSASLVLSFEVISGSFLLVQVASSVLLPAIVKFNFCFPFLPLFSFPPLRHQRLQITQQLLIGNRAQIGARPGQPQVDIRAGTINSPTPHTSREVRATLGSHQIKCKWEAFNTFYINK